MPDARDKEALLRQMLVDAGCDKALIAKCLCRFHEGKLDEMLPELAKHRKGVLSAVHEGQKRIDCLDYLTNKIKSNEYKKEKPSC